MNLINEFSKKIASILGFLTKGARNVNLIEVNWESASRTLNYYAATRYVPSIGSRVAEFVDFMVISQFSFCDIIVIII